MKKIVFCYVLFIIFFSMTFAEAATVRNYRNVNYYKTASTNKKGGVLKKTTKLHAKSMKNGFVKFVKGKRNYFIKLTDVKTVGRFKATLIKKANIYNSKFKVTKRKINKHLIITISKVKIKNNRAYLKFGENKFVRAIDVKVNSFDVGAVNKKTPKVYVKGDLVDCGNFVKIFEEEVYSHNGEFQYVSKKVKVPFVRIMESLGATFKWKTKNEAVMLYNNKKYLFNNKNGTLVLSKGFDRNYLSGLPGAKRYSETKKKEFLIDTLTLSKCLFEEQFGLTIEVNIDEKVIKIVDYRK